MIKAFFKKNLLTFVGLAIGAVGGFLYWKYVGCTGGTVPLPPRRSTAPFGEL